MNYKVNAQDGLFEIEPNEWIAVRNKEVYFLVFEHGTHFDSNMYGKVRRGSVTLQTFFQEEITCKYALINIHDKWALRDHRRKNFLIQAQDFLDNMSENK